MKIPKYLRMHAFTHARKCIRDLFLQFPSVSQIQKEHHAEQTFDDVDQAMKQYYYITGKQLDPLPPEPKLSDYYAPSSDQQNREMLFIVAGMAATGFVAYKFL